MVYLTGDIHGNPRRFKVENFPDQKEMTKDDFVIILGDFGLVWSGSDEENYWLDWLNDKPFTTLFVDGNHENFEMLYKYPVIDFHGGKVHKIRNSVFHLMRGYVFDFCGKSFFAFGGAKSHDIQDGIIDPYDYKDNPDEMSRIIYQWYSEGKMFRVNHVSWWEEELPTDEEMERGRDQLEKNNWEVDFVISHCLPQFVASVLGYREPDVLTNYFNDIAEKCNFEKWYGGHYHTERQIFGQYVIQYESITRII